MSSLDRYFAETPKKREQSRPERRGQEHAAETSPSDHLDLWPILQETVKNMILFPRHLAYVREYILPKHPDIRPEELSAQLGIPLGAALVILEQLRNESAETE